MKKLTLILILTLASVSMVSGQAFTTSVVPALELPVGSSTNWYSTGGGADIALLYALGESSGLRLSGNV